MTENSTATPEKIIAGDSVSWTLSLPDYPASAGWALSYSLVNSSAKISISSTSSGDDHVVSLSAATTGAYTAGDYKYSAFLTLGSDRYTYESGTITILQNFAAGVARDTRTFAEICLANIEAVISGKASSDSMRYTINGRELWKYSFAELWQARGQFLQIVNRERRAASGKSPGNKVLVRFV